MVTRGGGEPPSPGRNKTPGFRAVQTVVLPDVTCCHSWDGWTEALPCACAAQDPLKLPQVTYAGTSVWVAVGNHHWAARSSFSSSVGRLATRAPDCERERQHYCQFPSEINLSAALQWGSWGRRLEGVLHCLQLALGTRLFWGQVHETCLSTKAFTCGSYLLFCKGVILERVTWIRGERNA